jgi:hypothetical protein
MFESEEKDSYTSDRISIEELEQIESDVNQSETSTVFIGESYQPEIEKKDE